ncbi:hypothetical protein GCM10009775_04210 [Microbacterium aoyamense]|uniref:Tyr recombinase domain-containing protein n=1 Tax=Microbacterium aoyamense TaxID=344166 RepID=A0ABP5AIL1_9MICO
MFALRHSDIDFEQGVIKVRATLADGGTLGTTRQPKLVARTRARRVLLLPFALAALAEAKDAADDRSRRAPAIQSRDGSWVGTHTFRRQLREVRVAPTVRESLAQTGLDPKKLTPLMLSRTASTLGACKPGRLRDARSLLGHSDVNTTRRRYAGVASMTVDELRIFEALFGQDTAVGAQD